MKYFLISISIIVCLSQTFSLNFEQDIFIPKQLKEEIENKELIKKTTNDKFVINNDTIKNKVFKMKLTINENFLLSKDNTLLLINQLFDTDLTYSSDDLGLVDDLINQKQNPIIFLEENYKTLLNFLVWSLISDLDNLSLYPKIKKIDDSDYEFFIVKEEGNVEVQVSAWVESSIEDLAGISPFYTVFDTLKYSYFN